MSHETVFCARISVYKNAGCFRIIPKHSIDPQAQQRLPKYALQNAAACETQVIQRMIDQLLEGNKKFRETVFKQNFDHYQELVKGQSPPVLWIGCSDSRLQTGHITQMKPGHLFIQRNIGNVAPIHDWNFATVLEYAIKHLKVKDIVICGHSDCGAIKALDKELDDVYIPLWLNNAIEAKNRVDSKIKKPTTPEESKKRSRMIEQENVRLQIEHLKTYPLIKTALREKALEVHGLYYDLETGALTKIA
jgi:carbonic anhydrase